MQSNFLFYVSWTVQPMFFLAQMAPHVLFKARWRVRSWFNTHSSIVCSFLFFFILLVSCTFTQWFLNPITPPSTQLLKGKELSQNSLTTVTVCTQELITYQVHHKLNVLSVRNCATYYASPLGQLDINIFTEVESKIWHVFIMDYFFKHN